MCEVYRLCEKKCNYIKFGQPRKSGTYMVFMCTETSLVLENLMF